MSTNAIRVGALQMSLPEGWQRVNSMPDDPPASVAMATQTPAGGAFALLYPMPATYAMPFGDSDTVVGGIHRALAPDQGLVQVEAGTTHAGRAYVYSIVKTRVEPSGVQYSLTLHVDTGSQTTCVQAFCDEGQPTGVRDAAVFSALLKAGEVGEDLSGWQRDPYDPAREEGFLANLSELPEFDHYFPGHPLSLARELVRWAEEEM